MNKREINIRNLEDLEREELRVMRRIKKQESELAQRVKQLPEEVVTTGVVRIVSAILEGGAFRSIISIVKKIGKNAVSTLLDNLK